MGRGRVKMGAVLMTGKVIHMIGKIGLYGNQRERKDEDGQWLNMWIV